MNRNVDIMEHFSPSKLHRSEVRVSSRNGLQTRSGRLLQNVSRRQRSKTTDTLPFSACPSTVTWSMQNPVLNNTQSVFSSSSNKSPVGITHFNSVPSMNFSAERMRVENGAFGSTSVAFGSNAFGTQNLSHRDLDTEEAMEVDCQDEMDTHISHGQTDNHAPHGHTGAHVSHGRTNNHTSHGHMNTQTETSTSRQPTAAPIRSARLVIDRPPITANNTPDSMDNSNQPSVHPKLPISESSKEKSTPPNTPQTSSKALEKPSSTSSSKPPQTVTPDMIQSPKKSTGKKKAIYIVLHVGKVVIGGIKAKAVAPVKIYAEKIFLELEFKEGDKSSVLRIPLKDFTECLVTFQSPNPVLVFTFCKCGAKEITNKLKDKGVILDHKNEEPKKRRIILNINCNYLPRDVKTDLIELFQRRMSDKLSWREMSSSELKEELKVEPAVAPLGSEPEPSGTNQTEAADSSTQDSSAVTGSALSPPTGSASSPVAGSTSSPVTGSTSSPIAGSVSSQVAGSASSPVAGSCNGRKILTPKKSSARRKLYEKSSSSPSKPSSGSSEKDVQQEPLKAQSEDPEVLPELEDQVSSDSRKDTTDRSQDTPCQAPHPESSVRTHPSTSLKESTASMHRDNADTLRDSPRRLRDMSTKSTDKLKASPTKLRNKSTRMRGGPVRPRDSPIKSRDSQSKVSESSSPRSKIGSDSPSPRVKRDLFSRLTSGNVRDIFPTINHEAESHVTQAETVTQATLSCESDTSCSVTSSVSGSNMDGCDVTRNERAECVTPEPDSKVRDMIHHHGEMESHINMLGKHSEKQRYTLEQHQKLLSLERAERTRNMETIQGLSTTLADREQQIARMRDEIALLGREVERHRDTVASLQQDLRQERETSSRLRKVHSELTHARRALDEERVLRSVRDQQVQEKDQRLGELQRVISEEARVRGNLESELRNVRSACLQHMDELENQRLFRQTQDQQIQGREDRIAASERRYQDQLAARLRLDEDFRRLQLEKESETRAKDAIQAELIQERERRNNDQASRDEERQNYDRQLHDQESRILSMEVDLRAKDDSLDELRRRVGEAQAMLAQTQDERRHDLRSLEPRNWIIPREEVTVSATPLGTGAWGSVKVGTFRGSEVAVKQIHELILSPHNRRLFEREMSIASRCRHPCLLQFIGATNDDGIPLFLTEILDSDLRAVLFQRALHQEEIISIGLDCARALNYLHLSKPFPIIHRDISSSNVLLWKRQTSWRAKLSDYGAANFMRQCMTVNPGAGIYAAPEASTSHQSPKVDVYSFGLLLCEMSIRELPVPQQTREQVSLITNGVLRELVMRCLKTSPEARPSMSEIITLLEQQQNALRDRGLVHVNGRSATL
ncbi:uncharacterized protein LOC5513787 isoform X1 [Nematostella vectensis]|uniref:uncharacterized protein LOC5513787 isoform X1 n=2 Tax=Nematostella vectensis TaxID=45351 RepID=UPI0020773933|nr:uncharacterized protein LOC5513787 isoform X1 [Nematostella vectensis]